MSPTIPIASHLRAGSACARVADSSTHCSSATSQNPIASPELASDGQRVAVYRTVQVNTTDGGRDAKGVAFVRSAVRLCGRLHQTALGEHPSARATQSLEPRSR